MTMIRNETMIKKMEMNKAALVKKNDDIQAKADAQKATNLATIEILDETIAKFKGLAPAAEEKPPLLAAMEGDDTAGKGAGSDDAGATSGEANTDEAEKPAEEEKAAEEEEEEQEKAPKARSGRRR